MELQKMFIDGEWVEGSTGKSVPTLNPSMVRFLPW